MCTWIGNSQGILLIINKQIMKKNLVYIAAFMLLSTACGDTKKDAETTKAPETVTEAPPPVPTMKNGISKDDYEKGLSLIAKSDCLSCHKVSEKLIGPAYVDVANRYTNNPDTINMLATKILKGGAGRWGQIPMTPHPTLSQEDAVQMVKYVLAVE